jgi:3-methyladenine DNA glycosylase AlkD
MDGDTGRAKTPEEAAEEAIACFKIRADEERAAKLQRYFKEPVNYYGVDYGWFKEWKADFLESLRPGWTVDDAVRFCEIVLEDDHMESRGIGYQVVGEFVEGAGPELLEKVKSWLEGFCGNWGLVDNLAPSVLTPLLRKHPELAGEVKSWASSPNQWVRRGSAVGFVDLVGEEPFKDDPYEVATALQGDEEDLTRKAVGWLLREAGKVDRDRLEAYLLEQGPKVPRTTLRYAIEKFPKEDRKRIMAATK